MGRKVIKCRKKRGSGGMSSNVLDIRNYGKRAVDCNVSMLDMIFNPSKRVEMYKTLDRNYVSTKEEDDIFDETCQRRKRDF